MTKHDLKMILKKATKRIKYAFGCVVVGWGLAVLALFKGEDAAQEVFYRTFESPLDTMLRERLETVEKGNEND